MKIYSGNVAGSSFEPAASNIAKSIWYELTEEIELIHNPENQFDKNAVEVYIKVKNDFPIFIGYVPRPINLTALDIGLKNIKGRLLHFNTYEDKPVGAAIELHKNPEESLKNTRSQNFMSHAGCLHIWS
jgi:hypothetical protein